jgi:hypothetical protein
MAWVPPEHCPRKFVGDQPRVLTVCLNFMARRNRYAIKGACDDGCGDVGDYLDACCCVSCTLVQEMNELRVQGAGPNG